MPRRCCGHGRDHAELPRAPPSVTHVYRSRAPRTVPPERLSVPGTCAHTLTHKQRRKRAIGIFSFKRFWFFFPRLFHKEHTTIMSGG